MLRLKYQSNLLPEREMFVPINLKIIKGKSQSLCTNPRSRNDVRRILLMAYLSKLQFNHKNVRKQKGKKWDK